MSANESMSSKDKALRQSKIRRASQLSSSMKEGGRAKDASEYVKRTKAILDFQITTLLAQRALLEELAYMSDEEKMEGLFELLDKDGDGSVDATELADGLRKIRGDVNFEESLVLAIDRIATFDKEGAGKLNKVDFATMITSLSEVLGVDFHQVSEMMIMLVVFESGNNDAENFVGAAMASGVTEVVKEEEAARRAMVDSRMKSLFELFDTDNDGNVDFKELVKGLYRVTEDLEGASKTAVVALLLFDEDSSRTLNYDQFAKFIINIIAATPDHLTFEEVADVMTRAASKDVPLSEEELKAVTTLETDLGELLDEKEKAEKSLEVTKSQISRAKSLFLLWDLDQDGKVDIKELALGLRKFENTGSMQTTLEEAIETMNQFDFDGDAVLDVKEFILFMIEFAQIAGVSLDELLDFMIVKTSLTENTDEELNYIKSLTEVDIYWLV